MSAGALGFPGARGASPGLWTFLVAPTTGPDPARAGQGMRWNQAMEAAAPSSSSNAEPPMNSEVSSRFSST
jgi:hypothetical protein